MKNNSAKSSFSPILSGIQGVRKAAVKVAGSMAEIARRGRNVFSAGLEAARTSSDTWQHWWAAKSETPLSVVPPYDREVTANKARLEFLNNEVAIGFADTYELYVAGTGPRLRFVATSPDKEQNKELNQYVEKLWKKWSKDAGISSTLRNTASSMMVFGEGFNRISHNPNRDICGLNYTAIDSLRVGNPAGMNTGKHLLNGNLIHLQDGVCFDEYGNITGYFVYKTPENDSSTYDKSKYEFVPADQMHHVFRRKLPEMPRGYSGFAPIMDSLGRIRDYRDNVVEAARTSAGIVAIATSSEGYAIQNQELFQEKIPWYTGNAISLQRNKILYAPPGSEVDAFVPSQPTTNSPDFIKSMIALMGRAIGLSRRHSTGDSSDYNFTSGRLDNQSFELLVSILQTDYLEAGCLDPLFRIFYEFIREDLLIRFGSMVPDPSEIQYEWIWPSPPPSDPESQARANAINVTNGQDTLRRVWKREHDEDFDDVKVELVENLDVLKSYGKIRQDPSRGRNEIESTETGTRIPEPEVSGGGGLIDYKRMFSNV